MKGSVRTVRQWLAEVAQSLRDAVRRAGTLTWILFVVAPPLLAAVVQDFNGDGKSDILWRNAVTGENYLYFMDGTAIAGEGYIRTVAEQSWQVAGVGDFDGDG